MRPSDRVATALIILGTVLIALALIIPATALLSIWGDEGGRRETVLRIGLLEPVDSLNPQVGFTKTAELFYSLVYDGLQSLDENMGVVPNLAVSSYPVPTIDPEMQLTGAPYGSVWQYNLTTNAYWTDGEPFTADDVVWNIQLNTRDYEAMWAYQPSSYFMKDAVKIDPSTVRVYFYERSNGTPMPASYAGMLAMPMLPKHMMEGMSAFDVGFNWSGVFEGSDIPIVGTGPFMANPNIRQEWLSGDHITLLKNPRYHWKLDKDGAPEIKFDKLMIFNYDDPIAMKYALSNQQLDIARFPWEAYSSIVKDIEQGRVNHLTAYQGLGPVHDLVYLSWLMNEAGPNPARLDPEIRTALAMATNRSYIVETMFHGLAEEATTITSPINRLWHYEPTQDELFPYNIDEAMNVLEDSGYVDTDGDDIRECTNGSYAVLNHYVHEGANLSFTMAVWRDLYPESENISRYLVEEWSHVGVELKPRNRDSDVMPLCPVEEDVGLLMRSCSLDPNEILFAQTKKAWGGWSDTKYSSAPYEESYNRSVYSMSYQERKTAVDECQRIHYRDLPYQNLVYPYQMYAWRNDSLMGWGDWSDHPGMSLENTWGAHPLLFTLVPVSVPHPQFQTLAYSVGIVCGVTGLVLLDMGLRRRRRIGSAL